MLQFSTDLYLNKSVIDVDDDVNRAIAVARPLTSIYHRGPRKYSNNEANDPILFRNVIYDDSASGDILKLAQTYAFALQLFYDRKGCLDPNTGLQTQIAQSLNDDLLRFVKGSPEDIQRFNVCGERLAFP